MAEIFLLSAVSGSRGSSDKGPLGEVRREWKLRYNHLLGKGI
jgi:hypothetical protein